MNEMGLKVSFFILWLSGYYLVIQNVKAGRGVPGREECRKRSTKKRGMQEGVPGRDRRNVGRWIKDIKDIRTCVQCACLQVLLAKKWSGQYLTSPTK